MHYKIINLQGEKDEFPDTTTKDLSEDRNIRTLPVDGIFGSNGNSFGDICHIKFHAKTKVGKNK